MKTLPWFTIGCFLSAVCVADDFYLKDHAGRETGPFQARQGTKVEAGGQEFVVSSVARVSETVREAMERIVIPEIEFRNTSITNAIDSLMKVGKENDPAKKGVSIQLWPPATVPPFKNPAQGVSNVTLTARNITLASAVRIVAEITGLECRIDAAGVRLASPDEPEGEILHRIFRVVEQTPACVFRESATNGPSQEADGESDRIKSFLALMGVRWPRGASITYRRELNSLLVANTEENLDRLARVLRELNVIPRQVEIDMLFVQFDTTNLMHLAPGDVNAKSLMRAWTNGCGRLLAAPRVITRSGAEASIRGVSEVIYPTSFVSLDGCVGQTNAASSNACQVSAGTDFATREVGAILTVLPEIVPNDSLIHLTLTPQYVDAPTWKDYGYDLPVGTDKSRHVSNEQPIFYAYSVNTQVSMADGATVLVGGGMPTRDGKGIIYSFLSARLVGIDGEPLRTHSDSPDSLPY